MGKSYGFIEISGVTAAISALDIMCKTADVEFVTWERKQGGRLVTIIEMCIRDRIVGALGISGGTAEQDDAAARYGAAALAQIWRESL